MAGDFTEQWKAAELAAAEARRKDGAQSLEPTDSLGSLESGEPTKHTEELDASFDPSNPDSSPSPSEPSHGDEWRLPDELSAVQVNGPNVSQGIEILGPNAPAVDELPHPADDVWLAGSDTSAVPHASHVDCATIVLKDRDREVRPASQPDPSVWDEIVLRRRHKVESIAEPGVFRETRVPERALARPVPYWPLAIVLGVLFVMGVVYFLWWKH